MHYSQMTKCHKLTNFQYDKIRPQTFYAGSDSKFIARLSNGCIGRVSTLATLLSSREVTPGRKTQVFSSPSGFFSLLTHNCVVQTDQHMDSESGGQNTCNNRIRSTCNIRMRDTCSYPGVQHLQLYLLYSTVFWCATL